MSRMEITPRELRDLEIHSEIRGYSRDEVNDLLERAAASIDAANQRATQLQERLTSAQGESGRTRETEDILHRTLLLAQRAADEAVAEATAKSRQMVDEAEMSSRRLVADAEAEARRRGESERRRLEQEIVELAGRRDTLLADVEAMTRFEAEYRERLVRALETDLSALRARQTTAPASKPEASDVEIPAVRSSAPTGAAPTNAAPTNAAPTNAAPTNAAPTNAAPTGAAAPIPSAPVASGTEGRGESKPDAKPEAKLEAKREAPAGAQVQAPPARPSSTTPPTESAGAATSEVDVRTLFEQRRDPTRDQPAKESVKEPTPKGETASPGTAPAPGSLPIDLADSEGIEGNLLDDDAFFATLRDAVHDEKPLGPRDDDDETGENQFFDQDAERGTFRDVFRRRR
jgi:cell division septum initiation protein DivIVA